MIFSSTLQLFCDKSSNFCETGKFLNDPSLPNKVGARGQPVVNKRLLIVKELEKKFF